MQSHEASKQIYRCMKTSSSTSTDMGLALMRSRLSGLGLQDHFQLTQQDDHVGLIALTEFGSKVLEEVDMRMKAPPCPPGDCEYEEDRDDCMWCGGSRSGRL